MRKKISELSMLSLEEEYMLKEQFNNTFADYPKDKCVHLLFEEQVLKTPDKTAVIACDKTLTYDELNKLSNRIAHSLIEKGVNVNDIVAFALPRNSYLIATMFGILKSGGAYMPIDPDYPQDRIKYMLKDSDAKFFITEDNINDFVSDNEENPKIYVSPDSYYCALHTSGSTGTPKMSLLYHNSIMNFLYANARFYDNVDAVVSATIITFDAFIMDSVLAISYGKPLYLMSNDEMYNQNKFEKVFKNVSKAMFFSTPTKLKSYIDNSTNKEFVKNIKSFVLGGEIFTEDLFDLINENTDDSNIYNIYGPTETTICVVVDELKDHDITIGKPIANTQIYIVDKYNNLMPIGKIGELCIAGDGVGAGYLNRPELTAEKFVDNPFGEGRMYKTGDLAYWREDGNIAYVGRNDFQVKIRGLRIELGEIESAIDSVDGVSQAVVVVRKDTNGRQLICAFYTENTKVDVAEIKSAISSKLPKYMMPHIFTVLSEMPLTTSGKINRKALPEVDLVNILNDNEYVAPTTEKESILCQTIESILNAEKVGTADNFFDLGGDSLKAIELISKLESKGYKTTVKTVFECETVKELAEQLEQAEAEIIPFEWVSDIPATDAQMRVYTAQSMQENSTLYNVPYCFKTEGLDVDKLQNAVNKLIARHEVLRTHFENKDGHIIQVINETASIQVERLSSDNILDFIKPFNLEKAPLIRVGCYESTVMVDIHHIITDGSSMPVFFNELNELYMGRTLDNTSVQYKEFAVCEQNHTESEKYWLSVFDDEVPVLEINTDFPRGNKQTHNGSALYDTIDIELHNKIRDKCKELNITPYAFYMSGFNILLSKFSGCENIVVGMPISGRDSKFLNTMGMFVNTIALRNKPLGTKSVSEFLTEVKENSVNAIANQDYPFGELTKKLNIETSNRNPLFDVMFAYQSEEMTDVVFGDKKAELLPIPITTSKYDLTLNVMPRENDVVLMAEYCTDLYKESTMQRMVEGFKQILCAMLDNAVEIKDISALTEEEKKTLLYDFNNTKADYPKDKCVHQLFEEQVLKTPDKTAVIACDKTLTYDELNKLSNKIANSLIEKGIKANDIVAFALPRESSLIAVMFGILKSGAAYMPIDPAYPQDRIDYMISNSDAKFFIIEENINEFISTNEENPTIFVSPNNYYCALHTSGSTGTPKMSLLYHKGIMNFLCANTRFYDNVSTVVSATIITFDAFIMDSVLAISYGKQLYLMSNDEMYNQNKFEKAFKNIPDAMFFSTPTKLKSYIDNSQDKEFVKKIKSFVLGGEIFTEELYELIITNSANCNVFNIYGPTETTICSTNTKIS